MRPFLPGRAWAPPRAQRRGLLHCDACHGLARADRHVDGNPTSPQARWLLPPRQARGSPRCWRHVLGEPSAGPRRRFSSVLRGNHLRAAYWLTESSRLQHAARKAGAAPRARWGPRLWRRVCLRLHARGQPGSPECRRDGLFLSLLKKKVNNVSHSKNVRSQRHEHVVSEPCDPGRDAAPSNAGLGPREPNLVSVLRADHGDFPHRGLSCLSLF